MLQKAVMGLIEEIAANEVPGRFAEIIEKVQLEPKAIVENGKTVAVILSEYDYNCLLLIHNTIEASMREELGSEAAAEQMISIFEEALGPEPSGMPVSRQVQIGMDAAHEQYHQAREEMRGSE